MKINRGSCNNWRWWEETYSESVPQWRKITSGRVINVRRPESEGCEIRERSPTAYFSTRDRLQIYQRLREEGGFDFVLFFLILFFND